MNQDLQRGFGAVAPEAGGEDSDGFIGVDIRIRIRFVIVTDADLIALVNKTVQIYSKECLFFRSTRPTLSEDFILGEHRTYGQNDPIEALVASIPGVAVRERTFRS